MIFTVQLKRRHVANAAFQAVSPSNRVMRYQLVVKITILLVVNVHQKLAEFRERLHAVKEKGTTTCLMREGKIEVGKLLGVPRNICIQHRVRIQIQASADLVCEQKISKDEPSLKANELKAGWVRAKMCISLFKLSGALKKIIDFAMDNKVIAIVGTGLR